MKKALMVVFTMVALAGIATFEYFYDDLFPKIITHNVGFDIDQVFKVAASEGVDKFVTSDKRTNFYNFPARLKTNFYGNDFFINQIDTDFISDKVKSLGLRSEPSNTCPQLFDTLVKKVSDDFDYTEIVESGDHIEYRWQDSLNSILVLYPCVNVYINSGTTRTDKMHLGVHIAKFGYY